MVEEFDLFEEVEVQFCDEECTASVWHGVSYCESLFSREKPKSELTVVIREEGMMYFLTADIKEFAGLCRKHGLFHCLCIACQCPNSIVRQYHSTVLVGSSKSAIGERLPRLLL